MPSNLIHIYFMPGLAASSLIFEFIELPKDKFKIHLLDWMMPIEKESLESYSLRMTLKIEHKNPVLVGVSFGGVLVQEMSKHIQVKKLIIISSVKSFNELPKKMYLARRFKAYKLLPTGLISNFSKVSKYTFGDQIDKRVRLYERYLSMNNRKYLDWAIKNMLCWNQNDVISGIIHIHGDNDPVFPISTISDCIIIKGGTHIMIINKFKWFNENLPRLILE